MSLPEPLPHCQLRVEPSPCQSQQALQAGATLVCICLAGSGFTVWDLGGYWLNRIDCALCVSQNLG